MQNFPARAAPHSVQNFTPALPPAAFEAGIGTARFGAGTGREGAEDEEEEEEELFEFAALGGGSEGGLEGNGFELLLFDCRYALFSGGGAPGGARAPGTEEVGGGGDRTGETARAGEGESSLISSTFCKEAEE